MNTIKRLSQKIASGKLEEAINDLKIIFEKSPKLNEIIVQSARYNKLKEQIRLGLIDLEKASISENKITLGVLELISEIDDAIETNPDIAAEINRNSFASINQNHTGSGDNIAGDKIINNK